MSYANNTLATNPPAIVWGAKDQGTIAIDYTNALSIYTGGTVPTTPTVTVTNYKTGQAVALPNQPGVTGMEVTQYVGVGYLLAGNTYLLTATAVPSSASSDVVEEQLLVVVPGNS